MTSFLRNCVWYFLVDYIMNDNVKYDAPRITIMRVCVERGFAGSQLPEREPVSWRK